MRNLFCEVERVKNPLVENPVATIAITTFNRPDTFREALLSALNQTTARHYEIIVCDNGGTAETRAIVASFANESRLGYFVNKENLGAVNNWNQSLVLARGKYVTILHDDDVLAPGFLERALSVLDEGKYDAYFCRFFSAPTAPTQWDVNGEVNAFNPALLLLGSLTAFPGVLFPASIVQQIGYFEPELNPCSDYAYWTKMATALKFGKDQRQLAFYRKSAAQDSASIWRDIISTTYLVLYKILRGYGLSPRTACLLSRFLGARTEYNYKRGYGTLTQREQIQLWLRRRLAKILLLLGMPFLKRRTLNFKSAID